MQHHNTEIPRENIKPIICYIPADAKIKINEETLHELDIDSLCQVELSELIEQLSEAANKEPYALAQRLRKIVNDACCIYNRRAGQEIYSISFVGVPQVEVPASDVKKTSHVKVKVPVTELKPNSEPVRKGKQDMIEMVKRIKAQIKLGASNSEIEKSVGLSASFISKVRSGNKYPEVKID